MEKIQKISSCTAMLVALLCYQLLPAQTPVQPCPRSEIQLEREPAHRDPNFTFGNAIAAACHRIYGDDVELYPASLTLQIDLDTSGTIQKLEICRPQDRNWKLQQDLNSQLEGQRVFTPAILNGQPIPYKLTYHISCLLWKQ